MYEPKKGETLQGSSSIFGPKVLLDDSRDSSNCSPNAADTRQCEDLRQSSGEDCPLVLISKSTLEMVVSGTTVNG